LEVPADILFYLVELFLGWLDSLDFSRMSIARVGEEVCGMAISLSFKIGRGLILRTRFYDSEKLLIVLGIEPPKSSSW